MKRRDWKDPFSWFRWFHDVKPDPVFLYRPEGGRIGLGQTFSRADATTCAMQRGSDGIWSTVAANVLRDAHYHYDGTSQYRTTLREGAGTNSALGACSFGDGTYWTGNTGYTLTTATSCISGQTAYKHTAAGAGRTRFQTIGTFVNGQTDCGSVIIENTNATVHRILIWDGTAGASLCTAEFTWATKAIAIAAGSGTCGVINLGDGRYRIWVAATGTAAGTGAAGNTRIFYSVASVADTESVIVHHAQFEAATPYPSSPIVTVASAVTRAADVWSFSWPYAPTAATFYVDSYNLNAATSGTNFSEFHIGTGSTTTPYLIGRLNGATMDANVATNPGSGLIVSAASGTIAYGNRVEHRCILASTGAVTSGVSINSAAESVGATSAAAALAANWSAQRITIGALQNNGQTSNLAIRSIAIVLGPEQSMATLRRIARG